jgi:transcriptional regulator with XRE-family HTH domain
MLKRIRDAKRLQQKQVASHLRIPLKTYQAFERGTQIPDPETLRKIAALLLGK